MYLKALLSKSDVAERKELVAEHEHRSEEQWPVFVKGALDGKVFPVYLNGAARNYASSR